MDPSTKALGWCLADPMGPLACGHLPAGWDERWVQRLLLAGPISGQATAPVVVIEDQYVGQNMRSALVVCEMRMRAQVAASLLGLHVVQLLASTWQALLREPTDRFQPKRAAVKARADVLARAVVEAFQVRVIGEWQEDTADAVAQAIWVGRTAFGPQWGIR